MWGITGEEELVLGLRPWNSEVFTGLFASFANNLKVISAPLRNSKLSLSSLSAPPLTNLTIIRLCAFYLFTFIYLFCRQEGSAVSVLGSSPFASRSPGGISAGCRGEYTAKLRKRVIAKLTLRVLG